MDIVITTALIPGRAAPRLITAADVALMKAWSSGHGRRAGRQRPGLVATRWW